MSSVQHLREFISQRLTAAAEEIFSELEKTIVQYEDEIDRQRRLLEVSWTPQITLSTSDLPQHFFYNDERFTAEQQLCNQERNSTVEQEGSECPQIKEEEEELCSIQGKEEEQVVVKLEMDSVLVTPAYQETDHSEAGPNRNHLVSQNSHEAERPGPEKHSGSTTNKKLRPKLRPLSNSASERQCGTNSTQKSIKCDVCGKAFKFQSQIRTHYRVHTGEKPFSCKICGNTFTLRSSLNVHMRTHTGEFYLCKICGKKCIKASQLKKHRRTHTGEKPFPCKVCGKSFSGSDHLNVHMRIHTGEKPYSCKTCEKSFAQASCLTIHMRTHTGEKPFSCTTCGKCFSQSNHLISHMQTHSKERLYTCEICGKSLRHSHTLLYHMTLHMGVQPYACEMCGESFKHRKNLDSHIKTHSAETSES